MARRYGRAGRGLRLSRPGAARAPEGDGPGGRSARHWDHRALPVVLKPETWPVWLGEEPAEASAPKALLRPISSDEITCWPVSARVGNVKNNDASLIEPIAA